MKNTWKLLALSLTIATPLSQAGTWTHKDDVFKPLDGWYLRANVGPAFTHDIHESSVIGAVDAKHKTGVSANAMLGYRLDKFSLEAGLVYQESKFKRVSIAGVSKSGVSGRSRAAAVLVNAYYHPFIWHQIEPYIGAGAGYANVQRKADDTLVTGRIGGDSAVFGYNFIAGLAYYFNTEAALTLDYRYFATTSAGFTAASDPVSTKVGLSDQFQNHAINFGFVYSFSG